MVLISSGISLMTLFMGGLASPYYAGLTLTIVASGLLYVWPRKIVIITHTVIFASFVIPNLAVSPRPPLAHCHLEPALPGVDRHHRGGRPNARLRLAARTSGEAAHHRKDEEEPRVCARPTQEARPLQVRVLRQHHARAEDPAHHDARAARAHGRWPTRRPHPGAAIDPLVD